MDTEHCGTRIAAVSAETARWRVGAKMRPSDVDGQITYDFEEFCEDYGHPQGQLFTFEVTCRAVTYVYAGVAGIVRAGKVIFELSGEDLVSTRKAH
jgi:hypothetical protein